MKPGHRLSLGRLGESIASSFLLNRGYTLIEKNYRTPYGEIDLIFTINNVVAFIEVKTRSSTSLGPPEISITPRKQGHMRSAAEYYIQQHPEMDREWRIDVITIQLGSRNSSPVIDHFENALS